MKVLQCEHDPMARDIYMKIGCRFFELDGIGIVVDDYVNWCVY